MKNAQDDVEFMLDVFGYKKREYGWVRDNPKGTSQAVTVWYDTDIPVTVQMFGWYTKSHECNDRDDVIYGTASGKIIQWNTHRQWAHLTTEARRPLIYTHYEKTDDPICMESSTCSICKESSISKAYWL